MTAGSKPGFSVVVKTGTRLNQLRFRRTRGEDAKPINSAEWNQLLEGGAAVRRGWQLELPGAAVEAGEAVQAAALLVVDWDSWTENVRISRLGTLSR